MKKVLAPNRSPCVATRSRALGKAHCMMRIMAPRPALGRCIQRGRLFEKTTQVDEAVAIDWRTVGPIRELACLALLLLSDSAEI